MSSPCLVATRVKNVDSNVVWANIGLGVFLLKPWATFPLDFVCLYL